VAAVGSVKRPSPGRTGTGETRQTGRLRDGGGTDVCGLAAIRHASPIILIGSNGAKHINDPRLSCCWPRRVKMAIDPAYLGLWAGRQGMRGGGSNRFQQACGG